jgi:hypothetical protein
MMLGDIPFDEITLGTRVQGAISEGEVIKVAKNPRLLETDPDGWEVTIRWDHSGREVPYVHWWMLSKLPVLAIAPPS